MVFLGKKFKKFYWAQFVNPSFFTDKYISRLITDYSGISKEFIKRAGD
jgi:hypothetical protein